MNIDLSERCGPARRPWKAWFSCALVAAFIAGCGSGEQTDISSGSNSTSGGGQQGLDVVASVKTIAPKTVAAGDTIHVTCVLLDADGGVIQPDKDLESSLVFVPEDSVETDASGTTIAVRAGAVDVHCTFPSLGVGDATGATIAITPGPVASVDTAVDATSVVAGGDLTATCTAYDAYGNLVPDAKPTLSSSPGDAGNTIAGLKGTFTHSGLFDLACEVPGAASHSVEIEVTPGLPASLVVSPVPTKALYPVGSVVSLVSLVSDAYGNPVPAAPTLYGSNPGASANLGANHFQYLVGGFYTLTATVPLPTATGQELTASVEIEVGGTGPTIECDSPLDGAMLNLTPGSSVPFSTTVNSPNGVTSVTVNGVTATGSGGSFSASIATRFGINFADVVATDKNGAQSTRTCSFLVANQWAQETALYSNTIDLKLTQAAVDDANRTGSVSSFADLLYAVANSQGLATTLDSGLKSSNPLKPKGCDSQTCTFLGCICWYSTGIDYLALSLPGPQTVSLTLVSGGITAHAHIPNLAIKLHVYGDVSGIPFDTSGWVNISYVDVDMTLDTTLSGGKPRVTIRPGTVTTTVGTITTNFGGVDGWIINNVVAPLAQGSLKTTIQNQLKSYISNNFNSVMDGVLSGLDISTLGTSFNVPRLDGSGNIPLSFGLGFSTVSATSSRLLVGLSSKFTAPAGQATPSLGVAIPPGTVLDDPTVSAPSTAAAAIHVGVFNQALHALWRAGMFDVTLNGTQLGGLPAGAGAQIRTKLPPVAAMSPGSSVELSIGALQLAVTYPGLFGGVDAGGNPLPPLQVELGARATAKPTLVGNDLNFGNLVITELHFSTGDVSLDASTNQTLTTLLQKIVQSFVDSSLNKALPALPIPSFALPASLQAYGVPPGKLGLKTPSLGFDTNDFVLRGQLGIQ